MPPVDRIADLHCHPSFKSLLNEGRGKVPGRSAWDDMKLPIDVKALDILRSQSNLRQLHSGNVNLVVCGLYGLERAFARSELFDLLFRISKPLDGPFFRAIRKGRHGYRDLMQMDLDALNAHPHDPNDGTRMVRVLGSYADYQPNSPDVQVILSAEGGHNFYGHQNGADDTSWPVIRNNLDHFKQPGNARLLYITVTHLAKNALSNHCYGIKTIRDQDFFPNGHGLTPLGLAFIQEALDRSGGRRRILIDVKHMSLQSRIDFYRYRREHHATDPFPIICSHAGVAGISYTQIFRYVDGWYKPVLQDHINVRYIKPRWIEGTEFNPWSINLYNDDIAEIMASGGLIGISLDERILGFGKVAMERMSPHEAFKPSRYQMTIRDDRDVDERVEITAEATLKQFCANLLHMIRMGGAVPGVADPWDHVCIGSDFDGLIDTVNGATSADTLAWLRDQLSTTLPLMAAKAGIPMPSADLPSRIHRLFSGNLVRFLQQHFA